MKLKNLCLLLFVIIAATANAQRKVVILGHVPAIKDGSTISMYFDKPRRLNHTKNDTVKSVVKNGQFRFVVNINGGEFASFNYNRNYANVFLGPGNIDLNFTDTTLKKMTISGMNCAIELNNFYDTLNRDTIILNFQRARMRYATDLDRTDTALWIKKFWQISDMQVVASKEQAKLTQQWIIQHSQSYINCYILFQYVLNVLPTEEVKSLYDSLPEEKKGGSWGNGVYYVCSRLIAGAKPPELVQQMNPDGKTVHLSDFKGKYVLIDFWASWCVPCRTEHPYIVKALNKFGYKNLVVLAISLDHDKKSWLTAINHDGLSSWTHVSDLKGWDNQASLAFNVSSIPNNFLLNPDGIIIAKNVHGDDIDKTFSELIK